MRVGQRVRLVDHDVTGTITDFHVIDHRQLRVAVAFDEVVQDGDKRIGSAWAHEDEIELID